MKVCIYGAGAIGGHLAARLLAHTQSEVAIVARGRMLEGLRARGLTLRAEGRRMMRGCAAQGRGIRRGCAAQGRGTR